MSQSAYIAALHKLIERETSNPRCEFDGYVGESQNLTRLTAREAQTAVDFGILIGVCGLYSHYHGSRKDEYSYHLVSSVTELRRLLSERSNEDRASIAPHMRNPQKLLGYIREIHEIEDQMPVPEAFPSWEVVERLKSAYPPGCRVELVAMRDSYSRLLPGDHGTVRFVDDIGTVHVAWDRGSSLGAAYGKDRIKRV